MRSAASQVLVGALTVGGMISPVQAAGFALKEQSATAQGNAFAGATAAAEDVSFMFFNPAALGYTEGIVLEAVANYLAPRAELTDVEATTAGGAVIEGRSSDDDVAENALVPALYAAASLPGRLAVGIGITTPFGLETSYRDDWVGRYHALKSELLTVNINPAVAWRPRDWLALGLGFQVQYADGELSNAVDFGTIGAAAGIPGATPGRQDGRATLTGDDWGVGLTAGLIVEPRPGTRVGIAYRSEIDHEISGDAKFSGDDAGVAAFIRSATGAFDDTAATMELKTPASLSVGVHQALTDRLAVMAELQWTDWSTFDELEIDFENEAQPDSVTEERWRDSWFAALGATYALTDDVKLRGGVAFDQSPVRDRYRTPRIPDGDRYWLAAGASWHPSPWAEVSLAYTYIFVDDTSVDLDADDEGNRFRGDLSADYESHINLLALGVSLRF